ncbi:Uu.00g034990.m01.CDS01 [Anthostomella pinea]|uniref:Uu.00g034990.m01.CDS01 n=1 Tax=Anthostomella pinea TaxID=933095 RepID=A0AAI8V957_9PEZI|nr:Uu.00g034990.m01.CDS01 [Anthostomella pinea]
MAIIPDIKGPEVSVVINHVTADEYDIPGSIYQDANAEAIQASPIANALQSIKSIEARSKATFGVQITKSAVFKRDTERIGYVLELNGVILKGWSETNLERLQSWTHTRMSRPVLSERAQDIPFSWNGDLQIVEDDTFSSQQIKDVYRAAGHGSIRIHFHHLLAVTNHFHGATHESCMHWKYQDPNARLFATFEFLYRSTGDLLLEGIITPHQAMKEHNKKKKELNDKKLRARHAIKDLNGEQL